MKCREIGYICTTTILGHYGSAVLWLAYMCRALFCASAMLHFLLQYALLSDRMVQSALTFFWAILPRFDSQHDYKLSDWCFTGRASLRKARRPFNWMNIKLGFPSAGIIWWPFKIPLCLSTRRRWLSPELLAKFRVTPLMCRLSVMKQSAGPFSKWIATQCAIHNKSSFNSTFPQHFYPLPFWPVGACLSSYWWAASCFQTS